MPALPDIEALAPHILERCLDAAAPYSFSTFLLGIQSDPRWRELPEHDLLAWKRVLKNRVGLALCLAWEEEHGRLPDFERPQLRLIWSAVTDEVQLEVRSVFLYGRYRKLARGLPQTRAFWKCPTCRGGEPPPDCDPCRGTGKRYPVAVEDLLGRAPKAAFGGEEYQLHGMGREDIDVRCLGAGRPFVLEIQRPRLREADLPDRADLADLARKVEALADGQVELPVGLRYADDAAAARLKGFVADKSYLAVCESEAPLDPAAVTALGAQLSGVTLEQRTPVRVTKRRSDKVRRRVVRRFVPGPVSETRFEAEIQAQSGTYIKELISSDEGRTVPSVAGLLGVPTTCVRLDVLEIVARDEDLLPD